MLIVVALFTSCSNDEDNTPPSNDMLLGDWQLVEYTYEGSSLVSAEGIEIETLYEGVAENIDSGLTFTSDPNQIIGYGSYDIELTVSSDGFTDTQLTSIDNYDGVSDYVLDGNRLIVTGGIIDINSDTPVVSSAPQEVTYIIEELTDTNLRITFDMSYSDVVSGYDFSTNAKGEMVLVRE